MGKGQSSAPKKPILANYNVTKKKKKGEEKKFNIAENSTYTGDSIRARQYQMFEVFNKA